jgi:hypothetical protein
MSRRKGVPRLTLNLAALAREHSQKALNRIVQAIDDPDPKVALIAANMILDRGHGRPSQTIVAAETSPELMDDHNLLAEIRAAIAKRVVSTRADQEQLN